LDAAYIRCSPLLDPFKVLIRETKSEKLLDQFLTACTIYDEGNKANHQVARKPLAFDRHINYLGQLQFKDEPAGKVRVFAMVDSWTQSLLRPLHEYLSLILKQIPNDGTFDQDAAFKRAVSKAKVSKCSFGYDLSAATDRLPLAIQVSVLTPLLGADFAKAWGQLLTSREYIIHMNKYTPEGAVKYSVGQPMGALSSFNMLALTHHLLLQYCALKVGASYPGKWFEGYEILGDDIVIFNHLVAFEYLSVCKDIGMEINVKKSVVSFHSDVVEFAKRTSLHGVDVSAIPMKLMFQSGSLMGRSLFSISY